MLMVLRPASLPPPARSLDGLQHCHKRGLFVRAVGAALHYAAGVRLAEPSSQHRAFLRSHRGLDAERDSDLDGQPYHMSKRRPTLPPTLSPRVGKRRGSQLVRAGPSAHRPFQDAGAEAFVRRVTARMTGGPVAT